MQPHGHVGSMTSTVMELTEGRDIAPWLPLVGNLYRAYRLSTVPPSAPAPVTTIGRGVLRVAPSSIPVVPVQDGCGRAHAAPPLVADGGDLRPTGGREEEPAARVVCRVPAGSGPRPRGDVDVEIDYLCGVTVRRAGEVVASVEVFGVPDPDWRIAYANADPSARFVAVFIDGEVQNCWVYRLRGDGVLADKPLWTCSCFVTDWESVWTVVNGEPAVVSLEKGHRVCVRDAESGGITSEVSLGDSRPLCEAQAFPRLGGGTKVLTASKYCAWAVDIAPDGAATLAASATAPETKPWPGMFWFTEDADGVAIWTRF